MKRNIIERLLLIVAIALSSLFCRADLAMPEIWDPALHRIGYEVFVYVASAIAGSALVRYIAKKNWHIAEKKGHLDGEKWKSISDLKEVEAAEIAEKIREIRQPLHTAVRKVYDKVDGFLEEGWKYDLVLSALEDDEELMMRCKGIPIECLMVEAGNAVKDEIEVRTAGVLPDFKRLFDAAYEVKMPEWLKADEMARRRAISYDSLWSRIRRFISPRYRHEAERLLRIPLGWRDDIPWWSEPIPFNRWRDLCFSLANSLLEQTECLKSKCRGLVRRDFFRAACDKEHPRDYRGEYYHSAGLDKSLDGELRTVIRDEVDIEKVLENLREGAREADREASSRALLAESAMAMKSATGRWRMAVCEGGGDEPRNETYLPDHAILVGRSRSADLRITCPDVSGGHCELIVTQEGASLHVLSRIGAMVDGARYAEGEIIRLSAGSSIKLGAKARIEVTEVPKAGSSMSDQ